MSRRHQYINQNLDPELDSKLRPVLLDLADQQIEELKNLSQPITTPYRVDPKSARAGEQYLDQHKAMENARAARKRSVIESLRIIDAIRTLTVKPQRHAERDESQDEYENDSATAQALIDSVRGRLNAQEIKAVRAASGDEFNVPMPAESDPDE